MSAGRILIVDDDAFIREFLSELLRYCGFTITTATNGVEALLVYKDGLFDLIISDMDMPQMNGLLLIEELKTRRNCPIPIIFLTANDKVDTAVRAMRLGATDYIFKEENIQETIMLAVNRALEEERIKRERQELVEKNIQLVADLKQLNEDLESRVRKATADLRDANDELNRSLNELSALHEVGKAVSSVMNLEELLDLVMENSKQVTTAEASSMMLVNEDKSHLRFCVTRGEMDDGLKTARIPIDENSISGWVAKNIQPLLIPDAYKDPRFNPEFDRNTGFRTTSLLCVPLVNKEEVIGVVMVLNHREGRPFNEDDLKTFQAFAVQAAVAIDNARLYESQKQTAEELRDALERERRITIEKEKMGKYIPQELLDEIQKNREQKLALGGKLIQATIMFSDIQGFTRFSEEINPQTVIEFLNQYMTAMTDVIEKYNGILDKFIGDGLMAVFTERPHVENHALRAVKAGVEMQLICRQITRIWEEKHVGTLNVRIGLNSGKVVSGNIGSEKRMDYTVIGDNVNLAARLEGACQINKVLISESTYHFVGDRIKAQKMDMIVVKNRKQPVQTYLIDPPENKEMVNWKDDAAA